MTGTQGSDEMPQQSIFFDEQTATKRVQVLKVYDVTYARSCFQEMDEDAIGFLSNSLDLGSKYEESFRELEWEDVEEEAREDGNKLSFFVVVEVRDGESKPLYVSPYWPSAEEFAKSRL
jgi:hypothetical protein